MTCRTGPGPEDTADVTIPAIVAYWLVQHQGQEVTLTEAAQAIAQFSGFKPQSIRVQLYQEQWQPFLQGEGRVKTIHLPQTSLRQEKF